MAETLKDATLPRALSSVLADLADLVQKEMSLARAEVTSKISTKLNASIWMAAAGVIALLGVLVLLAALVLGISATWNLPLYWSCVIVGGALVIIAALVYAKGSADAREQLTPDRTIHQVKEDIAKVKEQFS
jgi:hypothetical protein